VVYERNADRLMVPASNMKVVTAAAALSVLGPDYRFETVVSTDAPELGATLAGNLYVRGTGDPSLVSEELWKLAESIRVLGIERIEGDLVLDAAYFDSASTTSRTVANGDRAYHARTGALSLNFNAIAVHTTPSSWSSRPEHRSWSCGAECPPGGPEAARV
jgi:D-alanyl-D-alanine carboxypeptidase/D-alanyl-D-alanine-endopeptidase (penicillin-binding protein 4)